MLTDKMMIFWARWMDVNSRGYWARIFNTFLDDMGEVAQSTNLKMIQTWKESFIQEMIVPPSVGSRQAGEMGWEKSL